MKTKHLNNNSLKTQLFYMKISSPVDNKTEKYWHLLSDERRARIEKALVSQRALLAYSEFLVRFLACQYLNIGFSKITFKKNYYGKPYIVGNPAFHYNVSHSGSVIVVLISNHPIGIDVERIDNPNLNIAHRFFANRENEYVFSNKEFSSKRFYEIWTRKEAYIKYLGKGLNISLNSFDVLEHQFQKCFNTFEIDGYLISTFTKKGINTFPIITITENEILNYLSRFNL